MFIVDVSIHRWRPVFLNHSQFSALSSINCPAKSTHRHTIMACSDCNLYTKV